MQKSIYTGGGGGKKAIFREHENRTLVCCAINTHDLCIYRFTRARTRAHVRPKGTRAHVWAHMRARYPRLPELRERLQTETAPLQPSSSLPPSPFPEGRICIHTTSHTTRFNISGHGWKLSPETGADARAEQLDGANAAIFAIAPVSGVSYAVNVTLLGTTDRPGMITRREILWFIKPPFPRFIR